VRANCLPSRPRHKDGRQVSIEFSIQLLKDADGQMEWVVAVIRDVTERFIREKTLRAQLKALEARILCGPSGTSGASDGSHPTVVQQVGTPTTLAGADVVVIGD
jgi:hypothetical protein